MKSADGKFEYLNRDGDSLPEDTPLEEVGRLSFPCRSRDGERCEINIKNAGYQIEHRNWCLSGTKDQPTVSPSINCHDCFHGFIQEGVFLDTNKKRSAKQ